MERRLRDDEALLTAVGVESVVPPPPLPPCDCCSCWNSSGDDTSTEGFCNDDADFISDKIFPQEMERWHTGLLVVVAEGVWSGLNP
jgi:hypothetical protein